MDELLPGFGGHVGVDVHFHTDGPEPRSPPLGLPEKIIGVDLWTSTESISVLEAAFARLGLGSSLLRNIFLTHGHMDHAGALAMLTEKCAGDFG